MNPIKRDRLRKKILVTEDFVPGVVCEEILLSVSEVGLRDATVADGSQPSAPRRVDKKVRNVLLHDSVSVSTQVNTTLQRVVDELIEPFYAVRVDYWEYPDILIYPPGGFYVPHNDGEAVEHDPEGYVWEWRRTMDRDISVVWYLNEDFEGGELMFPLFQHSIRPATGMVVTFPSTHEYAHTANPVTGGMRYAVVTWMAVVGTARVRPSPPGLVPNRSWQR
jgi:predicted 2-oxoglutarate/Fe(II)-dependent dioxygenase YbiX